MSRAEQLNLFDTNPEFDAFVEKFKPKKTTDDCYTPAPIYDAIAEWVEHEFNVSRRDFVRPFYPDLDYQFFAYPDGGIVVDNPPFSILAQIVRFYAEEGIRFFLFAPALTLLTRRDDVTHIAAGVTIEYENGANVKTSFVTNLGDPDCILRTAPDLTAKVEETVKRLRSEQKRQMPKYIYPDEIVTAAMAQRWSAYGIDYRLSRRDCIRVAELDAQKAVGKSIFGGGYLLSERAAAERAAAERAAAERAAAERAAAERWHLSERERAIVSSLSVWRA